MVKKDVLVRRDIWDSYEVARLIQLAMKYNASLHMEHEAYCVNAKSMMGLLCLGLTAGMHITLIGDGADEAAAVSELSEFLTAQRP